jgi:hypothetical protein
MKELVVGLDGSPDSRRALRWAVALAERAGVPVRAVEAWSYVGRRLTAAHFVSNSPTTVAVIPPKRASG